MLSSSSSLFDTLPPRPPTPPREVSQAIDDAISFLDDSNELDRLINKAPTEQNSVKGTSDLTPSSSQDPAAIPNGSRRVDFSPNPVYHQIARAGDLSSPSASLVK